MNKIPYGKQHITDEDINEVIKTLKSDFLTQGPRVKEFEDDFAEYVGSRYAVAVSNGTAGLHLSALSIGLQEGDRIITTPITFASTANCARFLGAEVWFADIDPNTYLLDIDAVQKLIESKPKGFFKGIIPVDFAGLPVNLEEFRLLADKHSLFLIEDACHAPGAYFINSKGEKSRCGNGMYADLTVFSFHPVKHIACGEGGMITTNSKKLYNKLLLLRTHGITKENLDQDHGGWYYEMKELGFNYRLTDFQSALGISQLKRNDNNVLKRNELANRYIDAFSGKLKCQYIAENFCNAYHLFVVEVENRKELYNYMHENNIYVQVHYIPIYKFPFYKKNISDNLDLPNTEKYYKRCISLPMYPSLTDHEQEFVINRVLKFLDV